MNYQNFIIAAAAAATRDTYLEREILKPLHPVVVALLDAGAIPQGNCGELIGEWPHVSKDGKRVAYTQDATKGNADRQSVTDIGDYLQRYI